MNLVLVFKLALSIWVILQGPKSVILCGLLAIEASALPEKVFELAGDGHGRLALIHNSKVGIQQALPSM